MTCPAMDRNAGVALSSHMASLKPMFACCWAVGRWVWLSSTVAHIFASQTVFQFVFLAAPPVPSVTCKQDPTRLVLLLCGFGPLQRCCGSSVGCVPLLHLPFSHCHCSRFAKFMPSSRMLSWEVAGCCAVCVVDKLRISYFVS